MRGTYSVSTHQVATAEDLAVDAAVEHTRAQKALNAVLEETAAVQNKASGTTREMQMRILNLGLRRKTLRKVAWAESSTISRASSAAAASRPAS